MKFKSSYDTTVILISGLIILLIFYFFKRELADYHNSNNHDLKYIISTFRYTILLLLCLALSFCLSSKYYEINDSRIVIKRHFLRKTIWFKDIKNVERKYALDAYIRIFGIGGLFGYNGIFLTTKFKIVYLYTNRRKNLVKINRVQAPPIYISPDQAEVFIVECKRKNLMIIEAI